MKTILLAFTILFAITLAAGGIDHTHQPRKHQDKNARTTRSVVDLHPHQSDSKAHHQHQVVPHHHNAAQPQKANPYHKKPSPNSHLEENDKHPSSISLRHLAEKEEDKKPKIEENHQSHKKSDVHLDHEVKDDKQQKVAHSKKSSKEHHQHHKSGEFKLYGNKNKRFHVKKEDKDNNGKYFAQKTQKIAKTNKRSSKTVKNTKNSGSK